jgi:hypothetical protein
MLFMKFSQLPTPMEWDTEQLYYFNLRWKVDLSIGNLNYIKLQQAHFKVLPFDFDSEKNMPNKRSILMTKVFKKSFPLLKEELAV